MPAAKKPPAKKLLTIVHDGADGKGLTVKAAEDFGFGIDTVTVTQCNGKPLGRSVKVEMTVLAWAAEDKELWDLEKVEKAEPLALKALQQLNMEEMQAEHDKRMANLTKAFEAFDKDGSGELTTDEVITILMRMTASGSALTEKDARDFITEFDRAPRAGGDATAFFLVPPARRPAPLALARSLRQRRRLAEHQ